MRLPQSILLATTATAAYAQLDVLMPVTNSLMNITFTDPTNANECLPIQGQGNTSHPLSIAITSVPSQGVAPCFNLNRTFSYPTTNYNINGFSCQGDEPCGVNYTIYQYTEPFPQDLNFSQIFYTQSHGLSQEDDVGGRLTFWTYNGENCLEQGPAEGEVAGDPNGPIQPFYQWSCQLEGGSCTELPYGVKSFRIGMTARDVQGEEDCTVADVRGQVSAGVGGREVSSCLALGAVVMGFAFLL